MLFPQAARQKTISSSTGSKAVKQMGQSPSMALRFDGSGDEDAEEADAMGVGAAAKMSRSSVVRKAS